MAAWAVGWLFTKKPEWKKYEGMLITAVNAAEKFVPNGDQLTGWKGKSRAALDSFIEQYTTRYGQPPTDALIRLAQEALPIVHDNMTAKGTL